MDKVTELYEHLWSVHDDFTEMDESLAPRPPAMLYDVAERLGLSASLI